MSRPQKENRLKTSFSPKKIRKSTSNTRNATGTKGRPVSGFESFLKGKKIKRDLASNKFSTFSSQRRKIYGSSSFS
jgi:hypothetical protein